MSEPTEHRIHAFTRAHQTMGPGGEFDLIRLLMSRWGDLAEDIGDDAAVLPVGDARHRVITVDACVEGVHFRRDWISPREIGARATAAAISDVAAMGASPQSVLIAIIVPENWRADVVSIADGIGDVVRASGAKIIGGNLSRGDTFSISTTVIGVTANTAAVPVARRGARPGDLLLVTGELGGPASAIASWMSSAVPSAWARHRFASPQPRVAEGALLAAAGAHAMIDISDGLLADARHMAAASDVALRIEATAIPTGPEVDVRTALVGGEDYELLVAMSPVDAQALLRVWPSQSPTRLTVIGTVLERDPRRAGATQSHTGQSESRMNSELVTVSGLETHNPTDSASRVEFTPGHDHFSR